MSRLHVVSLPHTETTVDYDWCAYTSKVRKFCTMMHRRGHEVHLYAGEENEAECTTHTAVVTREDQKRWFSQYNFDVDVFGSYPMAWEPESEWFSAMNVRSAQLIKQRQQPGDLLCLIMGRSQQPISNMVPGMHAIEWGIGYEGVFSDYRAFESHAWRHYIAGKGSANFGRFYDTVIPNFFDPTEFYVAEQKGDYLLYLGRLHESKGVSIAHEVAGRTGRDLVIAGQGDPNLAPGADYRGVVRGNDRAKLLAEAHAILVPSLYLEPFGGVAVEAMLSGTPAITTNWGAFPETVLEGQTGFRCNMIRDFCAGVERADELEPGTVRSLTLSRFSLGAVAPQFERWFEQLVTLDGKGFYAA